MTIVHSARSKSKWTKATRFAFVLSLILTSTLVAFAAIDATRRLGGARVSWWTPNQATGMALSPVNTIPVLESPFARISEDFYVWDNWPLRNTDGSIATFDGQIILIALTAPRANQVPGERHGLARWRYFYTDGNDFKFGGDVFAEGTAFGERQWAGSAKYDPTTKKATFYYTALDRFPAGPIADPIDERAGSIDEWEETKNTGGVIARQIIASTTADVVTVDPGTPNSRPNFMNFSEHEVILRPDGEIYQTPEQARTTRGIFAFRDPWYFRDPWSGLEHLLFTAVSTAGVGEEASPKNGVAGLARRNPDGTWELLPPLITAFQTNSQIERPHLVVLNDEYYLFFTSHAFTFADGIEGFEGLYGLVSNERLSGPFTPLNGTGLVLANAPEARLQTYSYLVMLGDLGRATVLSFINYFDLGKVTLPEIKNQTRQWQKDHFGGTPSPLLTLQLEGTRTRLIDFDAPPFPSPGFSGLDILQRALKPAEVSVPFIAEDPADTDGNPPGPDTHKRSFR